MYQEEFGFSSGVLTVVFGVYAFALLAALLVVGALSDHIGRRPVLIAALLLQAVGMVVFLVADGVGWLIAARVVQGLSMGALTARSAPPCWTSSAATGRSAHWSTAPPPGWASPSAHWEQGCSSSSSRPPPTGSSASSRSPW
ncbi:MAG: MFS transporter [Actinomycetota bacterium]|nr:MFS transporter [Actinomycetota bacterium]